jgi:hypothetical protein
MRLLGYPSAHSGFHNLSQQAVAVKVIKLQNINSVVKKHLLSCEVAALSAVKNRGVCEAYDILKDE